MCDSKIRFICADPITNKCIPDRGNTSIVMGTGTGSVHGSYVTEEACKASWQCNMNKQLPMKALQESSILGQLSPPMPIPIPTMMPKFYAQQ